MTSDDLPAFGRPTIAMAVSRAPDRSPSLIVVSIVRAFGRAARELFDHGIEQIAHAAAMLGADFDHRFESQPIQLQRAVCGAAVVRLVDGHHVGAPVLRTVAAISSSPDTSPSRPSATNTMRSAVLQRAMTALDDELVQRIFAGAEEAAGVGQVEAGATPVGGMSNDVARRARHGRDDGLPNPGQPIEKG